MFDHAARKLEFDKVRERVIRYAASDPGRRVLDGTTWSCSVSEIRDELSRVTETKNLLIETGELPLAGIHAIGESLQRASLQGAVLAPLQLLQIASTLRVARTLKTLLSRHESSIPLVWEVAAALEGNRVLEFNIERALDESGAVRANASKELQAIRRAIAEKYGQLRKALERILKNVSDHGFTQDDIITTREGRMVIPVKAEHKNRVPGFVHSSSGSGATVFVEPTETLELNNEITQLQFQEQREIDKILGELSRQVGDNHQSIRKDLDVLARLDALHAKARYSMEILGAQPEVTEEGTLLLKGARHPLLLASHGPDRTVPLDLSLGETAFTLLISGPNAGGKSVAMKTVGVLCLMVQAGLHIPAAGASSVRIFRRVFADIGDEQSIENDLSTFSSHLANLKDILTGADRESLVLIDEIGSGTDPAEGGAIAAAVLQELTEKRALTIATTHQSFLKVWAYDTKGVVNGAMEFDAETLRPTYRFRSGVPGSSYALEMAARLGLDTAVLERSRSFLGHQQTRLESLIVDLEASTQRHRKEIELLTGERGGLARAKEEYEMKLAALNAELRQTRARALAEAREIIDRSNSVIEQTVREIRESRGEKEIIRAAREKVQSMKAQMSSSPAEADATAPSARGRIEAGSSVTLKGTSLHGTVESVNPDGKGAFAIFGNVRMKVLVTDLSLSGADTRTGVPVQRGSHSIYDTMTEVKQDLDLRGLTGDEALPLVDKFIDTAVLAGLHRVDIIHGKGTGALRKKISEFLSGHPRVRSYRLGEWNEGGAGATIVELQDE